MDRLEPGRDVGLGDLWSVRLQQMGLRGFNVRDRRCQALPQAQQVVNTVGGKLPVLQTGDGEVGDEADDLGVVFHFDQLPQLVVTLQPRQQAAELVVVVWIGQTLKHKHTLLNTHEATEVCVCFQTGVCYLWVCQYPLHSVHQV